MYRSIYFITSVSETLKFVSQEAKESQFNSIVTVVLEAVAFLTNQRLTVDHPESVHLAK